jgi:hypothetical protein
LIHNTLDGNTAAAQIADPFIFTLYDSDDDNSEVDWISEDDNHAVSVPTCAWDQSGGGTYDQQAIISVLAGGEQMASDNIETGLPSSSSCVLQNDCTENVFSGAYIDDSLPLECASGAMVLPSLLVNSAFDKVQLPQSLRVNSAMDQVLLPSHNIVKKPALISCSFIEETIEPDKLEINHSESLSVLKEVGGAALEPISSSPTSEVFLLQSEDNTSDWKTSEVWQENSTLQWQFNASNRDAEHMSAEMQSEVMALLQAFDLPFVVAPFEAEAQCAELERVRLLH